MKKTIEKYLHKWLSPLGLLWWEITITYYDDPKEILQKFKNPGGENIVPATVNSDWKYGTAFISINLPAFKGMKNRQVERIIVHELVHILVNEMREEGIEHEERVVTGLSKAFMWTANNGSTH